MKSDSLKKNTVMLYLLQMSTYVFPLLTFPYLTRVLASDTYGMMVNGNAVIAYFQSFVDFGFILSATSRCSRLRGNRDALRFEVSRTVYAKVVLSLTGFAVLCLLSRVVASWRDLTPYLVLSYISVFASCFIPDYLFRGIERMSTITYRTIAVRGLFTILVLVLVKSSGDMLLVPVLNGFGNIVASVWALLYAKRYIDFSFVKATPLDVFVILKESAQYFASRIAGTVYASSNAVVLGFFYAPAVVASYGVSNTIVSAVKNLAAPLSDSIFPRLVKTRDTALVWKILICAMPFVALASLLLFMFSDDIVMLAAGEGYQGASSYMRFMTPLILMALPNYLLGFPALGALGETRHANLSVIFSAILYIAGLILLYVLDDLAPESCITLLCCCEFATLLYRSIAVLVFSRRTRSAR